MSDGSRVRIERQQRDPQHGRYVATVAGIPGEAELTYTRRAANLISADHTGVPDSMSGMGIGTALVQRLVADARAEGFRIVPICPFVRAQAQRHPEWAELFAPVPGDAPAGTARPE